jgi:hypothetical protein
MVAPIELLFQLFCLLQMAQGRKATFLIIFYTFVGIKKTKNAHSGQSSNARNLITRTHRNDKFSSRSVSS